MVRVCLIFSQWAELVENCLYIYFQPKGHLSTYFHPQKHVCNIFSTKNMYFQHLFNQKDALSTSSTKETYFPRLFNRFCSLDWLFQFDLSSFTSREWDPVSTENKHSKCSCWINCNKCYQERISQFNFQLLQVSAIFHLQNSTFCQFQIEG